MAGTIKAGTLTDGTYSAGMEALVRGGIKAWILMNTTATPIDIKAHMGITSVTDNGVGNYILNFATPMANLNYGFMGSTLADSNGANASLGVAMGGVFTSGPVNKSLTSCNVRLGASGAYDTKELCVIVVGD